MESYAKEVFEKFVAKGIRVELDRRGEKLGHKIREAELKKIPYMAVIGQKEAEKNSVSVRSKKRGDLGSMETDVFIDQILKEVMAHH